MEHPIYYRHSGSFAPAAAGAAAAAGVAVAAALAVAYAYAVLYIPLAGYVSIVLSTGFGLGMGLASGLLLRLGKVRNVLVANLLVAGVALVGLYVAWAVWTYALLRRSGVDDARLLPILNPLLLGKLVVAINETGAWSIRSFTPTGPVLALFWLAELVIIFLAATVSGVASVSAGVFCESCGEWCQKSEGVALLGAQTPSYLRRRLEERDFPFLARLGSAPAHAAELFRVDLHSCTSCEVTQALSVQHVRVTKGKDGKPREETSAVVDKLMISPAESRWLRAFGEGRTPLPPLTDEASAPVLKKEPSPPPSALPVPATGRPPAATAPALPAPVDPATAAARRRIELSGVSRAAPASLQQVGSTMRMGYRTASGRGPRDATEALRFAAFRAMPSEVGLRISDHAGATREIAWTAVREIVVIQLPSDPPWDSAIVIDFVPDDGAVPVRLVTGSFIDWKSLPGGAAASPVENVRKLCRFALQQNSQVMLDEATRRFCLEGGPCRRLMGMRFFAEYDARYG
jgi:hypothetical protein